MIIDAHAHVFAFPKLKNPNYNMPFLSVVEQLEVMDAKGVDKTVILPIPNNERYCENQSFGEVLYICEQYPGRFIPFCNLDPRLARRDDLVTVEDYLYILEQYKGHGAKGFGELITRLPWTDPAMLKMLEACERLDLPVVFHTITPDIDSYGVIDYPGLPLLEAVLKRFPKLKFFGHSPGFWCEISGEVPYEVRNTYDNGKVKPNGRLIELFRNYPNLHGDISAGSGFNALQRDPEFSWTFVDEFQDRLHLGLDYCCVTNDMQHIEWLTQARNHGNISADAYEQIMWKNINRVLDLGLE